MPASLIFGKMGSNKTHFATYYALHIANKFHKKVVLNYVLHPDNLMQYCANMGYSWLVDALASDKPVIFYCDIENGGLDHILSIQDSVVVFDECALYVPSRGSGSVTTKSSKFHKDLTQIRHRFIYFLVIAQNHLQIDSSIRNLSEETFHCTGKTSYDPRLKTEKLWYKSINRFTSDNYDIWIGNPRLRRNPIKTALMRNKSFSGALTLADMDLFGVYQSFDLVHEIDLQNSFKDSWHTYYKEPILDKKSKNYTFSWAYIQPIAKIESNNSNLFSWFYTKMPGIYYLFFLEIKKQYFKDFILYKPSSSLIKNKVVLCLVFLAVFLYGSLALKILFSSPIAFLVLLLFFGFLPQLLSRRVAP